MTFYSNFQVHVIDMRIYRFPKGTFIRCLPLLFLIVVAILLVPNSLNSQSDPSANLSQPTIQTEPPCWSATNAPCDTKIDFAPDPLHPEHTPVKYVKLIIHVFQLEDPNDPDYPGNWQNIPAHLDIIKSWFTDPVYGINARLANLCSDPSDFSPDMTDARFRILFNGVPYEDGTGPVPAGADLFFHKDFEAWRTGFFCGVSDTNSAGLTWAGNQLEYMQDEYILPFNDVNSPFFDPNSYNAVHIFLTGATDAPPPMGGDCRWYCSTGASYMFDDIFGADACGGTPRAWFNSGVYFGYLAGTGQATNPQMEQCTTNYPGNTAALFSAGELLHVLTIDHPDRHHHITGSDQCDDTPEGHGPVTLHNLLDQDLPQAQKCALTECQLGRAHYYMYDNNPIFLRTPDNNFAFPPTNECNITEANIVIHTGEDITWDSPRRLRSNVIVQAGGMLTIKCRVGMPNGGKMTVQPGGRLTVDGGEVYNNCPAGWGGFVVNGNASLPWSLQNQGYLRLKNAALIQGATTSMYVYGGGRVLSTDESTIHNCGGAFFLSYPLHNTSWFLNTNFTTDGSTFVFPSSGGFWNVMMLGTKDIRFSGCDFTATNVPQSFQTKTYGISSVSSIFRVDNQSEFDGFYTGISANNWFLSPASNFTVDNCTFTNNNTGISAWGVRDFFVTNNTFNVGGGVYLFAIQSKGLLMTNCTGYTVERNSLVGTGNVAGKRIGILTDNSGSATNFIRKDTFNYLAKGNQAQLNNQGRGEGLQYWCNENLGSNTRDFFVANSGTGIFPSQGNGKAARNTFSHNNVTNGDFRNEVGVINYYYFALPPQNPNSPYGVNKIETIIQNSCPGDPGDEEEYLNQLAPTKWQEIEDNFDAAKSNWQTEKANLAALLDGGDTQSLLGSVNGANALNAQQVVQQLQSISPYLTSEVLEVTIDKISVLSSNAVQGILAANPDELGDPDLRSSITSAFPEATAATILSQTGTVTARTPKANTVSDHRAAMQRYADLLIRDIVKDTLQLDLPLLRTWLINMENLEADYAIVGTYIAEADYTTVYQKLSLISQNYDLTPAQAQAHNSYVSLVGIWQNITNNGTPLTELPSATVSAIQSIADNEPGLAGAMSRGFLNTLYGYSYEVVALDENGDQLSIYMPNTNGSIANATALERYVSAFPNPAHGNVTFNWILPKGIEEATITLTDIQGKVLELISVSGQYGSLDWDTERLDSGIYFFQIRFAGSESGMAKLVIIK